MRDAAAEADGFHVRKLRNERREDIGEAREVCDEFIELRPAADVRMEHDDADARGARSLAGSGYVRVPDAVLAAGAAGVAGIDVPVTKARIHAQADLSAIPRGGQLADHAWRADVRQEPVFQHHGESIVAKDIRREADRRRLHARGMPGPQRAQGFISRHRVYPNSSGSHFSEHFRRRAGLHGEARLEMRGIRDGADVRDAPANDGGIVEPERRAITGRQTLEKIGIV